MRWLLIVLLVSVCALTIASAGVAWHIWRQHAKSSRTERNAGHADASPHDEIEPEEAP
jgi:uncharacterized iron-regulated membrane protein